MKRHSIRLRMMLLFCLVVGVLLGCSGLVLYISFERAVQNEGDSRLLSTATPIIDDFTLDPSENDVNELAIPNEYFEVLDRRGQVLQRSENLQSGALPIPASLLKNGEPAFTDLPAPKGDKLRLAVIPFQIGQETRYFAIGASSRDAEKALATFRSLMFLLFPLSLLITAGVSNWYAGRSLRPIAALTEHVASTIKTLPRYGLVVPSVFPADRQRDELTTLSANFEELFGRLTGVMAQLQQFVSDASHELRTPLAVLQGETELLLTKARGVREGSAHHRRRAQEAVPNRRRALHALDGGRRPPPNFQGAALP
jgi:signal transduction histidine kinase